MTTVKLIKALDAVTVDTSSNIFWVGNYDRVALRFSRDANPGGGSSKFDVLAGLAEYPSDTPTMIPYKMLIENSVNVLVHVANMTIANATTNMLAWLDPFAMPTHIRVNVVETTDGTHSADIIGFCD